MARGSGNTLLACGGGECNAGEKAADVDAQGGDGGRADDSDESEDETVFYHALALLIAELTPDEIQHFFFLPVF
jgi:hypothetical protein